MNAATNQHGRPLIVTKLMDARLREGLGRRSFNEEETAGTAKEIANGVSHLHQTEPVVIIHRDIYKEEIYGPQNFRWCQVEAKEMHRV